MPTTPHQAGFSWLALILSTQFLLILFVVSAVIDSTDNWHAQHDVRVPVVAHVIAVSAKRCQTGGRQSQWGTELDFHYAWQWRAQEWQGGRINTSPNGVCRPEDFFPFAAAHPVGSTLTTWIRPDHPGDAMMFPDPKRSTEWRMSKLSGSLVGLFYVLPFLLSLPERMRQKKRQQL